MSGFKEFSNDLIDDISHEVDFNYFVPVWEEVFSAGIRPTRVLDIGCGNGIFSLYVKKKTNCHLTGVDGSEYALKQAHKAGFDEVHQITDFSKDKLPFEDNSFDFVLCKDVYEHLLHPQDINREVVRVMAPGAKFLLHVPNHFPLAGRLRFLLLNNIDTFNYFPKQERWEFPHIRFYTEQSIMSLCTKDGLKKIGDYSSHFGILPLSRIVPWREAIGRFFGKRSADHFCQGYTYLFEKQQGQGELLSND